MQQGKSHGGAIIGMLLLLCVAGCEPTSGPVLLHLWYFPFDTDTFLPLTSKRIERYGRHCEIRSPRKARRIHELLSTGVAYPSVFHDNQVRLKFVAPMDGGERALAVVELYGSMLLGEESRLLPSASLRELDDLAQSLCKK